MKKIALLVALVLVFTVALTACGGGGGGGVNRLLMVTGNASGTYYPFGGVIASTLTDNIDNVEITPTSSGASIANARALHKGEADLALLQNDVLDYAYNGTELLAEDGSMTGLRTIATLYPEVVQLVATVNSGITSVEDLRGKRVSVGDAGSGTEANARQILDAHGIQFSDFGRLENLSFGESSNAMQNGTIDAAFVTAGVPNAAITELNTTVDVVIIPVTGDAADQLIADYPFYSKYSIANNAYDGIPGADTVAVRATLAVVADLDEEVVYNLTKALFDNQPAIALGHAKGNELILADAVTGVSVPFHPGAERYYREVGAIS